MRAVVRVAWGAALLAALGACGGQESGEPSGGPAPAAASAPAAPASAGAAGEAQKIFATRCFTCHGAEGAGDGPGSAALVPKPRNFQDASWQALVSDDHLTKIIQYGGAAVGKSPAMPGNPDLLSKPEVVQALVAHVRSLSAAP